MDITVLIVTAAISSIVSAVVGGAIAWVKAKDKAMKEHKAESKEQQELTLKILKALTKDSYFRYCRYLIDQPDISESEFDNYEDLHDCYKALDMNGMGDWYHQQIIKKPKRTHN